MEGSIITVGDLAGTAVTQVAIDLQASGGGGDGLAESVIVNGGIGGNQIIVTSSDSQIRAFLSMSSPARRMVMALRKPPA